MKTNNLLLLSGLVGILATGCTTPFQVKDLARETQRATDRMANVHERDLLALSAYDQARVAQFNSFLGDYFALREDVARAFNDAFDRSRKATLAELDHEFDERAQKLLTVDFWIAFREEANKDLNGLLLREKEQATARTAGANAYLSDLEALNQSLLATRKVYAGAALKFDTVEQNFAELARNIRKARDVCRVENEKRLAAIPPLKLREEARPFTLPSNAEEVTRRINELRPAYETLRNGQGKLNRYLDEYNPTVDFLKGAAEAFIATGKVADSAGTNSLSSIPAKPSNGALPGLGGLLSGMQETASGIDREKTKGLEAMGTALQNVMGTFRPVIKTTLPDVAVGADSTKNKSK